MAVNYYADDRFIEVLKEQERAKNPHRNFLKDTIAHDAKYQSPFRRNINPNYLNYIREHKNAKYTITNPNSDFNKLNLNTVGYKTIPTDRKSRKIAKDIDFPRSLRENEEAQTNFLNELKTKENNLKFLKDSQNLVYIDEDDISYEGDSKYKIIEKPINIYSVPKIPSYVFTKVPGNKKKELKNSLATPQNKEQVIVLRKKDGLLYYFSKEVFDNIQYENKIHHDKLKKLNAKGDERHASKINEYDTQVSNLNTKIDIENEKIRKLNSKISHFKDFSDFKSTKNYLFKMTEYNNTKTRLYGEIEAIKNQRNQLEQNQPVAVKPKKVDEPINRRSKLYEIKTDDVEEGGNLSVKEEEEEEEFVVV
ncbi:hypothetical protein KAFR_0G03690 [Kazachstania africana CBS 2517]|uniref:Uncharacterized protein n=1 Tax=Kazachstania africana (strain ATCC 22294 / BCRC 22015 / CBS 2517 / CECT 1963 / NBRC 1671 / NRRL Y-8276) TaxID=1071382 RepID=H2AYF2_KAZAF|nr:hypothetical protein KAFR_0G03690 [Kazachstania africana CBS 2517]CCF59402.1 hypothetical protein KAFR_0G03690 [Kazachstania africana CBS 2517]